MLDLLSLLTRASATFFFALAAFLRFYGTDTSDTLAGFTLLGLSLAAFLLASAALLAGLGVEWNRVVGARARAAREQDQARRERAREPDRAARAGDLQARCLPGLLRGQRRDTAANRRQIQALITERAPELLDRPL